MNIDDLRGYMIERRKRLGLTQGAVALRMGREQSILSKMESGVTKDLTLDMVARWASALGLDASMQFRETIGVTFDLGGSSKVAE